MNHRQQMNSRQRAEWDSRSYKRMLEEKRGHNHSYMTDKLWNDLHDKGYKRHVFKGSQQETMSELEAIEARDNYRKQGNFARIISTANKLRIRDYEVWYKLNPILDPDSDGTDWLYRGCRISNQRMEGHPELLPYACYVDNDESTFIDVTISMKRATQIIDEYLKAKV